MHPNVSVQGKLERGACLAKAGSFKSLCIPHSMADPRLFHSQTQICHFPSAVSQSPQTYYWTEPWITVMSGFDQKPVMSEKNRGLCQAGSVQTDTELKFQCIKRGDGEMQVVNHEC